jgi:hypothetical protein
MSFLEDLNKVRRSKEFQEKDLDQHRRIVRLRREQRFKELEPVAKELLDALGMATWGTTKGERNFGIHSDIVNLQWRLHSHEYEYLLKLIFDEEDTDYFEVGVMGNMARSLDTSRRSLEHILKTIYKRGPDYLGMHYKESHKKGKK